MKTPARRREHRGGALVGVARSPGAEVDVDRALRVRAGAGRRAARRAVACAAACRRCAAARRSAAARRARAGSRARASTARTRRVVHRVRAEIRFVGPVGAARPAAELTREPRAASPAAPSSAHAIAAMRPAMPAPTIVIALGWLGLALVWLMVDASIRDGDAGCRVKDCLLALSCKLRPALVCFTVPVVDTQYRTS